MANAVRIVDRLIDQADVAIASPSMGQALVYDGADWVNTDLTEGTPGGLDNELQYNDNGAFAGVSASEFADGKLRLPISVVNGDLSNTRGALTLVDNVPGGDAKALALYNIGGGAGAAASCDFYNTTANDGIPQTKLRAVDDGAFSANLHIEFKVPGASGNSVQTRTSMYSTGEVTFGYQDKTLADFGFKRIGSSNKPTLRIEFVNNQGGKPLVIANEFGSQRFAVNQQGYPVLRTFDGTPGATSDSGSIAVDSTNKRLFVKIGSDWYYVDLTLLV